MPLAHQVLRPLHGDGWAVSNDLDVFVMCSGHLTVDDLIYPNLNLY